MLRSHCSDILEINALQNIKAASILLHGDPNDEFQVELEEFIFCRLIYYYMLCW